MCTNYQMSPVARYVNFKSLSRNWLSRTSRRHLRSTCATPSCTHSSRRCRSSFGRLNSRRQVYIYIVASMVTNTFFCSFSLLTYTLEDMTRKSEWQLAHVFHAHGKATAATFDSVSLPFILDFCRHSIYTIIIAYTLDLNVIYSFWTIYNLIQSRETRTNV